MNLRYKIVSMVAFVMMLTLALLFLSVIIIDLYSAVNRKRELENIIKERAPEVFSRCSPEVFGHYLDSLHFVTDWRIKQGGRITRESASLDLSRTFITLELNANEPPDMLYFVVAPERLIQRSYGNFFITGMVCMGIMMGVLYLLLSRLVIRPVDIVIAASKTAARGIKPGLNPIPGRQDEAGIMVREFYRLLDEVYEYRQDLEKKVREASLEIAKTQEQLVVSQRLSATGKLAAGIAHEINNPLGGMLNAVNKLKKNAGSEKDHDYFELLDECIHRIEGLVKELLSFVRQGGEFSTVDLEGCIDFARRMVDHYLEAGHIEFTSEVADGIRLRGHTGELQQMLVNLILNAIDSIEGDDGRISIVCSRPENSDRVRLEVSDNGCGIAPDDLNTVFDLFFTTKEEGQGTGLGLSIVHSIVKSHQGTVEIESVPGTGTAIVIEFPQQEGGEA